MEDVDMLMGSTLNTRSKTYISKISQTVADNGKYDVFNGTPKGAGSSLAGALSELPPPYHPQEPSSTETRGPVHNVPIEILLRIFRLIAPPRTRGGLYDLSKLTQVCHFWRMALINQPRVWSTVFVTQKDRRSFVEACLGRSRPAPLDVIVDAGENAWARPGCTCDKDGRKRLLPNEVNPCEWHFQFEALVKPRHSNRIRTLDVDLDGEWTPVAKTERLALGSCRFFASSFPRLTTLGWKDEETDYANFLFSTPPFPPTLRSLTYIGAWSTFIAPVNNLTSFIFEGDCGLEGTNLEVVRSFLSNNRSLESLEFNYVDFEGDPKGPPVHLPNLKSLSVGITYKGLWAIIRVPALGRLSSLQISLEQDVCVYTLRATGDGITFSARCFARELGETWEDLTGHAKPVIHHIRLEDGPVVDDCGDHIVFRPLLSDVRTLEIGNGYFPLWYRGFLHDLKELGPQLKVIRFAISEDLEPFRGDGEYELFGGFFLDQIEDLVKSRFEQGRPFSVVERMRIGGSERANRQRDYVWRCFYGSHKLGRYVRPV